MQIISQMCAREFKSDDRPDLYARTPPLEALKAITSVAANHKETFSIMHIDVSRAYFHAKAPDARKVCLMKKSMCGTGGFQLGPSSKNLFHHKENRVSGLTHGDDFVITGPTKKKIAFEKKMTSVFPINAKIIGYWSPKSIKTLNRRLHW